MSTGNYAPHRVRFEEIKSNIHLADNNGNDFTDKLFKLRPLVDNLHREFKKIPMPQELCVDEQMVPFKEHTFKTS